MTHFSCGDLLREAVKSDTNPKLKEELNNLMKEGRIVPVEITCALVKKAMEKAGGKVFFLKWLKFF